MDTLKQKSKISENIYFAFFSVVVLRHFLENTMIDYEWIDNAITVVSFVFGICVFIKILAEWKSSWGCYDISYAIITVGFLAAANSFIHHDYVWEYLILIMGARNIQIKKILKTYLIVTVPLFILTVALSLNGAIENLKFYRSESSDTVRYAMGFMYVTDFCAHLFFFSAAYAFIRGKAIKYIEIFGIGLVGVACYLISEGRNSTICIAILVVCLLIYKLFIAGKEAKNNKIVTTMFTLFMPLAAIFSIVMGLVYDKSNGIMRAINNVMGHRPDMDAEAFARYNITPFGQNFTQQIYGGEGSVGFPDNYFFIDCSYVSVLLKMGVCALIALIVMWSVITYRECKKGNYNTAIILCIVALHCFMEHHILNIAYNPFFLLMFAGGTLEYFGVFSGLKKKLNVKVIKNCLSLVLFAFVVELLAFNMQSLTSVFKSYINAGEYYNSLGGVGISENDKYVNINKLVYIRLEDVDDKIESFDFNLSLYDMKDTKLLTNEKYSYVVLGYNEELKDYEAVKAQHVNSGKPASGYVHFDKPLSYEKYMIAFQFDDIYQFDVESVTVNGPKPFDINYLRLLIIYIVLVAIYYFGIERRDAEVKPETIEVVKKINESTNQFEGTGALRTDAHRNMQAVYDKKNPAYIFIKRAFDIVCSGIAIIVLSPIFIITAIAVKATDGGPVFFCQMRAGKNLKPFKMWKFRSMYVNADEKLKEMMANSNEQTGHAFKMKNDPRITKVGKFIRKFSIDELPQLFNVFLGDMSIVGPRPILVFQMEECDEYDRQRLIVQPGLTCIWQVSGRANIKWDKWIELDLEYIDKMSVMTDIKLILKTVPVVITGDGAF